MDIVRDVKAAHRLKTGLGLSFGDFLVRMASPTSPSVTFRLPLTHEVRQVTTLPQLLKLAGTRVAVSVAWGIALRTYDRRKRDPGSTTLTELRRLARVLAVDERELFAMVSFSLGPPAGQAST